MEAFLSFFKILRKLTNQKSTLDHFIPVYHVNNQYPISLRIRNKDFLRKTNNIPLHLLTLYLFMKKHFIYKNLKIHACQYQDLNLVIYLLCPGLFIIHLLHGIPVAFSLFEESIFPITSPISQSVLLWWHHQNPLWECVITPNPNETLFKAKSGLTKVIRLIRNNAWRCHNFLSNVKF